MPIPFRAPDDTEALGEAAFLKFERSPVGPSYLCALLLVNAWGEPREFTYGRVETPFAPLWRPADVRRYATRALAVEVLGRCAGSPRLLLCLADETERDLFEREVLPAIPVCRVSAAPGPDEGELPRAGWIAGAPAAGTDADRLLRALEARNLLLEPFARASLGLREVYGPPPPPPA